jgi:hypothetical protein
MDSEGRGGRGHDLERFIYKRATLDDLEKLGLMSHKPAGRKSGGGARDIRFRPWPSFEPVVRRMFPRQVTFRGKDCYGCELHWREGDAIRHRPVRFCPPSGARGPEGWVAESYKIPAFTNDMPQGTEPPIFFLICQAADGVTWGGWMKEADLRSGAWHSDVADPVLAMLDSAPPGANVRGHVDLVYDPPGGHFGV